MHYISKLRCLLELHAVNLIHAVSACDKISSSSEARASSEGSLLVANVRFNQFEKITIFFYYSI